MHKKILIGILTIAFFLRVLYLGEFPIGLTPDEASFGYDAYSILKTGKDQWGHFLPTVLESFGDFKAPLYSYIAIPLVGILGLTKEAMRLPNAFLGVGAVAVTYFMVRELAQLQITNKLKKEVLISWALVSAFFVAINPWHVQLSRGAFEANMTAFFLPLGVLFFLKGFKNPHFYIFAALSFSLNLFTYHAAKVVTPLIVFVLVLLSTKNIAYLYKKYSKTKMYMIIAISIFFVALILTASTFLSGAGRRVSDVSIFNGALEAQADQRLAAIESGMNPIAARILHNKYFVIIDRFIDNYLSYFSTEFLFINGARESTYGMVPGIGTLYWFEMPFIIVFFIYAFWNHKEKYLQFILFWLIVSPIPASLTMGVGLAANRAATMLPIITIVSAFGAISLWNYLSVRTQRVARTISVGIFFLICIFSVLSFLYQYTVESQNKSAKGMLYGNLEVADFLATHAQEYNRIIVSRRLSEPHIYFAVAHSWDPLDYQKNTDDWNRYKDEGLKFLDQLPSYRLGKYHFKAIEDEDYVGNSVTLIVGRPDEIPDSLEIVKRIMYPNGEPAIFIAKPIQNVYANSL